ncbi:MAG: peptidoglycan-binding protein, partial [Actinobacteria bacterium]|nr:peptidoglycan-binding protein [Actinomycetota bacterium]
APVGSKSSYFPRSVTEDAIALTFLGFDAGTPGGGISQQADMNSGTGAWDPTFRAAVTAFQQKNGLTVDGWIGPQTRKMIKQRVDEKNASTPNLPAPPTPPAPIPPPSPSNQVPVNPAVPGQPQPATGFAALSTPAKIGIVAGAVALLGGGYYLLRK